MIERDLNRGILTVIIIVVVVIPICLIFINLSLIPECVDI